MIIELLALGTLGMVVVIASAFTLKLIWVRFLQINKYEKPAPQTKVESDSFEAADYSADITCNIPKEEPALSETNELFFESPDSLLLERSTRRIISDDIYPKMVRSEVGGALDEIDDMHNRLFYRQLP